MFMNNLIAPLEAVLFASGEPVATQQLMEILSIDEENVHELIEAFAASLKERESGLMLQQVAGGWQLVTRPEHFTFVEKLSKTKDRKLTAAALETLSIIAFKQPITKQEIEHIRGVRIERVMSRLLELELIKELGRKAVVGRPILYGTTDTFLKCFGLNRLEDLPELPTADISQLEEHEQLLLFSEEELSKDE